jgi:hypothetical protein
VFANVERTGAVSLLPRARRADVAAQTSATQALALQHAIGNRATRRVLSRDISHTTGTGFTRNADRPSWMADIKRLLVHWYNAEYRKSIDPDSVNLTKLNADRCHRRSWKVVEEHLASFLNGHTTEKDFREYLSELYHPFSDPGYRPPGWLTTAFNGAVPSWYNDMQFALDVLIGKRNAWQQNPRRTGRRGGPVRQRAWTASLQRAREPEARGGPHEPVHQGVLRPQRRGDPEPHSLSI